MSNSARPRRADTLTVEQAYIAMFLFLDAFFERGGRKSDDVRMLVTWANPFTGDRSPNPEEIPTDDPAYWYDWLDSVGRTVAGDFDPERWARVRRPPS